MKIKKFFENEMSEISGDRTNDIIDDLKSTVTFLNQKVENIDAYINEFGNFQNKTKSKNDQIDDSVSNLQLVRSSLIDSYDKLDNIILSLQDYNKSGRKYLY